MTQKTSPLHSRLFFIFRLLVSSGLLIYLVWVIDWTHAVEVIRQANLLFLLIAPLITLCSFIIGALRWMTILTDNQVRFSWFQAFRAYVLGLFYGIFLPGVLGGDAIRIGICVQKTKCSVSTSTTAVLLERIGGVVSLFSLVFFTQLVSPRTYHTLLPLRENRVLSWLGILGLLSIFVVVISRKAWIKWLPKAKPDTIKGKLIHQIYLSASTLATLSDKSLLIILGYSILFQLFDISVAFVLSSAIGLQLSFVSFVIVIPLTYLVLLLPISLGGLGLREGTLAFLLSRFGVPASEAVMLSFLIYINRMIVGLLGGGFQLAEVAFTKKSKPEVIDNP